MANAPELEKDQISASASVAYLATVLGVESFLAPPGIPTEIVSSFASSRAFALEGPENARLVFIAPSDELRDSNAELLSKMVQAMKVDPASTLQVSLASQGSCDDLFSQLAQSPRTAVVVLGVSAAKRLSGDENWIMARWLEPHEGIPVLITHSLAEIAGNNELKRLVWQHLQMVMKRLV